MQGEVLYESVMEAGYIFLKDMNGLHMLTFFFIATLYS